jgi:hypothetical protein
MIALGGSARKNRKTYRFLSQRAYTLPMPHIICPKAKPPTKPKRPAHRPTKFTPELGEHIGALIASGWSMKHAAHHFGIPPETVSRWAIKHEGFREVYALAREIAADATAEAKALDLIGVAEKQPGPGGISATIVRSRY